MKVALVYDRVNKWGGAERVLLTLHELFPDAPLYTSVYNSKTAPWANIFKIKTSFLQNLPHAASHHEILAPLMPLAFESFSFDEYDLVISLTSEAAKGIVTKPHTRHICYCLTPTRYLWSGYDDYFSNKALRLLSRPTINYLRKWDKVAARRPDVFAAISKEVKMRIKRFYQRDSVVIYPGLTLTSKQDETMKQQSKKMQTGMKRQVFFLVVSRLSKFTSYKRIDLAVKACTALHVPLKVIGGGNWEKDLRRMAGPTVEFLGNLSDAQLVEYYKQCKALIFPGAEDFGLTIIEAQRFGRPVVAFRAGGATETILDGKTGYFFNKQTPEDLVKALKKFDNYSFDSDACQRQAEKFSLKRFKKDFSSLVNKIL